MTFDEVVENRRSIRKFKNEIIEEETIKEIIKSAIHTPSAHNRQPWKVVILKEQIKNEIADLLIEKNKELNDISIPVTANTIKEAPILLAIFLDQKEEKEKTDDLLSIGAFIYHICLKATEMELGSLWIDNTTYVKKEITELTGVNLECISTVALGKQDQNPNKRPRKELEEIMIKNS